jgi:adenylate cyclase
LRALWRVVAQPAIAMALAIAVLAGGLGVGAHATGLLDRLEFAAVDSLYKVRDDPAKASDVVVVGVDENTLDLLDRPWPFRRSLHAQVVRNLKKAGVRAIAIDIQFTEEAPNVDDDVALFDAIRGARRIPVTLATTEYDDRNEHHVFGGEEGVTMMRATVGNATQLADGDGVVRRYVLRDSGHESFAAATAREALGVKRLDVPARSWIDFAGGPLSITTFSYVDVLEGRVPADRLRGKVVVVGATAPTLHDLHSTATSGGSFMNGPELQANAIQTLMRGAPLRDAEGWLSILFIVVAAFAGAFGLVAPKRFARRRWLGSVLAVATPLVLLAGVIAAIAATFASGVVLPVTYPLLAFTLSVLLSSALLLSYERHERQRERLRDAFARFVPEQAVEELLAASGGVRALRGVERDATVMFADLRGFTNRSQTESAQDVIEFLNRYLAQMSEAIMQHGGTVVSYMGDGVMAVFGAPLPQDDHADRALNAAREMLGPRLETFNAWLTSEVGGPPVGLSVGLHSGPVASGTVGSERRLEYAAVGHTTNVAARLESLTREVGADLLVSEATHERLSADEQATLHRVGAYAVKGVETDVTVWSTERPALRAAA